jgi:ABC-type ATPase with predicted acetyltransferase domain
MLKIAVIGGKSEELFRKTAEKFGHQVLHCLSFGKQSPKKKLSSIIKKADVVLIIGSACSHSDMYAAKSLSKKFNKKFKVLRSQGASLVIQTAISSAK